MKVGTRKLSRRGFGRLLAASPLAVAARAAAAPQALSREQELRAAGERQTTSGQAIAKFDLPMSAEPAFTFRP